MLTRIVFLAMLPVALAACSVLEELKKPTEPEAEEVVPLASEEALQALEDLGIPYSQRSFIDQAGEGNLEAVRLFVWAGMDVDVQPYAAREVLIPLVENPTRLGHLASSWFPQEEDNDTALMRAAGGGHLEVVKLLVQNGADREIKNQQDQNALMFAAAGGHLEVIKFLVEWTEICFDACEAEMMERGDTQFDVGRERCRRNCGSSGLTGANLGILSWDALKHGPRTNIQWAAYNGHLDVVEYLYPLLRGRYYQHPSTAFETAILGGHLDVVNFFIDHEYAKDKIRTDRGLMIAAYMNHVDIIEHLLEAGFGGSNIHYRTGKWLPIETPEGTLYFLDVGFGPLHAAIQADSPEALRLLLMHWMQTFGADAADGYGETALMFAAAGGDMEMAELLIANGAHVNARSDIGETALMLAARWGRADVVIMLLEEGADASLVSAYNETALLLAEENGHEDVVALLQ